MNKLKIEYLPVDSIKPYENNTRKHGKEDVAEIKKSIEKYSFSDPIGVWGDENLIVEGHGRLMAAKELGMKEVPTIRLDHLTDEERREYAILHNRTAELSEWDFEKLKAEMEELHMEDFDFQIDGFDSEIAEMEKEIIEDDIPEEVLTRTKPGDVWQLGEHLLVCGDSTEKATLEKIMRGGQRADMVFTDPPYGVSIGDRNKAINEVDPGKGGCIEKNIEGDTLAPDELYKVLVKAFTNLRENGAADHCSYYVSSPQGGELGMMMMMMKDAGLQVRHMLIWVKNTATFSLGRLDYDYRHEPIFYTWTKKHNFYGGYGTTVIDDSEDFTKKNKKELIEIVRKLMHPKDDSVIYEDKPHRSDLHPTMKPVKLVAKLITNNTREGDIVADIFGGSGTTMIACEQLNRKCRMVELDPHYCDVIVTRWETFTGKKAEKIKN